MRRSVDLGKLVLVPAFVGAILVSHGFAAAARPRVTLGEVTTGSLRGISGDFRDVVSAELGTLELGAAHGSEGYVLSASLVTLKASRGSDAAVASCTVSATLRSARGGAIIAMLRGTAKVTDAPREIETVKEDAMRGAVRSALRRVPEALASTDG